MTTPAPKRSNPLWNTLTPIIGIILLVGAGLLFIQSQLVNPNKSSGLRIEADQILPDFTITRIDGTETRISDVQAKVFLVNFWATWCEACMSEMPSLVKLREEYKDKGFEVIGINLDENPSAVVPRVVKQFKMEFPVFKDPEGKTAELFEVHAIPLTVIMNQKRVILFVKDGEQDWNSSEIHSRLDKWLSG